MAKYLDNTDLLQAIEESKLSYCSYVPGYEKYHESSLIMPDTFEEGVIYRVQTYDHIPLSGKLKVTKESQKHLSTNFKPFVHVVMINDELKVVLKSHWKGDLEYGSFSTKHGKISNNLGRMIVRIVNEIASSDKYNKSSYIDGMKSYAIFKLTRDCLQFNQIKGNQAFAYYTSIVMNSFKDVVTNEKRLQKIADAVYLSQGDNYIPRDQIRDSHHRTF